MVDDYEIVVVIDFGIIYLGYVYCFKSDFKCLFLVIKISVWKLGMGICDKFMKILIVVLFDQN